MSQLSGRRPGVRLCAAVSAMVLVATLGACGGSGNTDRVAGAPPAADAVVNPAATGAEPGAAGVPAVAKGDAAAVPAVVTAPGDTTAKVPVGVAKKLIASGKIAAGDSAVICVTGNGLKTLDAIVNNVGQPREIKPSLREFESLLAAENLAAANA